MTRRSLLSPLLLAVAAAVVSAPAWAHPGHEIASSFASGIAHPLSGLDHLLAMLAVGLWAAQGSRASRWLLPILFPVAMLAGGMMGFAGLQLPAVEAGIAASVLVLGLLVATATRAPLSLSLPLVALFALFHGHAHGSEMPLGGSALLYATGFVLATATLHMAGLGLGRLFEPPFAGRLVRAGGAAIAVAGIGLFLA
jgi:urease accessory protein